MVFNKDYNKLTNLEEFKQMNSNSLKVLIISKYIIMKMATKLKKEETH